jgi:hypothetical protein
MDELIDSPKLLTLQNQSAPQSVDGGKKPKSGRNSFFFFRKYIHTGGSIVIDMSCSPLCCPGVGPKTSFVVCSELELIAFERDENGRKKIIVEIERSQDKT